MTSIVEMKGVTKRYGNVVAVRELTLDVHGGHVLGIVGPSGCGKTTVLRMMDLLEKPDEGSVRIMGTELAADTKEADSTRRSIGMVLQKPVVLNRSVRHNLSYSLELREMDTESMARTVASELRRIGLADRASKNARTLSGGEMQRLSFARTTLYNPKLLLLDEFTANLDPKNVGMLEEDVKRFITTDSSRAVVMVTHNMFQAKRMCDRLALMLDGELVEVADKNEFFESPQDPRTSAFVKGDLVY